MATFTVTPQTFFSFSVDGELNSAGEIVADLTAAALVDAAGALLKANNLSDLASAATARTNLGGTTVGKAVFTAVSAAAAQAALGATAVGSAVFAAVNAPAAATAIGATAVGAAVLTALNAAAAATAIGATAVGGAVLVAVSTAAAQTAIGITPVGQTLTTAASVAVAANAIGANAVNMSGQFTTLVGATAEVKRRPWCAANKAGFATNLVVVIDGALLTADATIAIDIVDAAGNVTGPTTPALITLTQAGSVAGQRFAVALTDGNALSATSSVRLTVGGGNTADVGASFTVEGVWA